MFWQATALVVSAAVIGVPVGIAVGRWSWMLVAHEIGVPGRPAVSWAAVALVVVGGLAVANLAALVPGTRAARRSPASELSTG